MGLKWRVRERREIGGLTLKKMNNKAWNLWEKKEEEGVSSIIVRLCEALSIKKKKMEAKESRRRGRVHNLTFNSNLRLVY